MSRGSDAVRALRVGAVVVVAMTLLAAGVWTLGESSRVWSKKDEYRIYFTHVQGLGRGSSVSLAGYNVGTVHEIRLPEDFSEMRVEVWISVERANRRFLRADTRARLLTMGLLGDVYIDLTPGSAESPMLDPGAEIRAEEQTTLADVLAQGQDVTTSLASLSQSLTRIVKKIEQGQGLLGAMIMDTQRGRQITDDISSAAKSMRTLAGQIAEGKGVIGMLFKDPKPAEDLRRSLDSLQRTAARFENSDGLLMRLLEDDEFADRVLANLDAMTGNLRQLTARLDAGQGIVRKLMEDEAYGDQVLGDLQETTASVARITRRIEEGEGSLGKLIADETLYRGMNDLLAGANKSVLTRWFVTRSQRRGAEDRQRGPTE